LTGGGRTRFLFSLRGPWGKKTLLRERFPGSQEKRLECQKADYLREKRAVGTRKRGVVGGGEVLYVRRIGEGGSSYRGRTAGRGKGGGRGSISEGRGEIKATEKSATGGGWRGGGGFSLKEDVSPLAIGGGRYVLSGGKYHIIRASIRGRVSILLVQVEKPGGSISFLGKKKKKKGDHYRRGGEKGGGA